MFRENNKDHLSKFTSKSDEGIFLVTTNKVADMVLIGRTRVREEKFDVKFDDFYVRKKISDQENKFHHGK